MANRTTTESVKAILADNYDHENNPSLTPFMRPANLIVSRVKTCATNKGIVLSTDELEAIECWLAAHFYCISDKTYQSRSTSGASGSFVGQTGMMLDFTEYGQQAQLIDYSNCLRNLNKQQRARFGWLGKPVSQQIEYEKRD